MGRRYARNRGGGSGGTVRGCISRYGGVGGGCACGSYDISMVDKLMLKFRPIAPKPGSGSRDAIANKDGSRGRGKRSVRVIKNPGTKKINARILKSSEKVSRGGDAVETLSLMPETPEAKDYRAIKNISSPILLCVKNNKNQISHDGHVTIPSSETPQTVSFVIVDRVTETSLDGGLVEWTEPDMETCPMFISDSGDRVAWMNKAYKEMVADGDEVAVVLVRKEGGWPAAFTCNVRVTWQSGMGTSTLTVPCDTWRMESGGYAWRLDVKTALCLGRHI